MKYKYIILRIRNSRFVIPAKSLSLIRLGTGIQSMIVFLWFFPFVTHAAPVLNNFRDLAVFATTLFNQAIAVIAGLAVVYILFGIAKTLLHADNEKIRSEGRTMMLYGVVALFVIVSMWGLINVLVTTFFDGSVPSLP